MRLRCGKKACTALAAFLVLVVPVVACSQKSGTQGQQVDSALQTVSGSSQRTVIVGQVTAVVGNQVTIAVGNLNGSGGPSSSAGDSSDSASSQAAAFASSSLITLTGETKTLLIPVGLTLSNGSETTSRSSGSGSDEGVAKGGSGQAGGSFGGTASGAGAPTRASSSGSTVGAGAAGLTQQRSGDFSSITTGMILQIAEETLSDGTEGVVSVSVLSR